MRISGTFTYRVPKDFYFSKDYILTVEYTATSEEIEDIRVYIGDVQGRQEIWELLNSILLREIEEAVFADRAGIEVEAYR